MLAYKGFDKGLICRDYQFNPGLKKQIAQRTAFIAPKIPSTALTIIRI